jgi:hypothetical protein
MAGGILGFTKKDPKSKLSSNQLSPEILKDGYSSPKKQSNSSIFGLNGILSPGQTVDFNKDKSSKTWAQEFIPSHLVQETDYLNKQNQQEYKKEIEELLAEVKRLAYATDNLETSVQQAVNAPVVEVNTYQISILKRIKNLIAQFRINVSEASNCFSMSEGRKKKKNAFWNKVKNKKNGGEQYLMSNEHSAARSAA